MATMETMLMPIAVFAAMGQESWSAPRFRRIVSRRMDVRIPDVTGLTLVFDIGGDGDRR